MEIHELAQGSPEWCMFRLDHDGASEAAAMLGISKLVKRNELLHMKKTSMPKEFSEWVQRNILDYGHSVEGPARALTEKEIGQDLYPVTCSEGRISASCDGLTMSEDMAWEHKQWNVELAASVAAGVLPEEHKPQVYQVLMVTKAKVLIFTVSDGTEVNRVSMKIYPDEAWFERIRAGWAQFAKDLAVYEPVVVEELPRAEPIADLPAATVQVRGELTLSNLSDVTPLFDRFLAEVKTEYKTDNDFAFAKAHAKKSRDAAKQCRITAKAVVDQMQSVAEATRTLELYADKFDAAALAEEKAVEQQEKLRKAEAKLKRDQDYIDHITKLNAEIAPLQLVLADADKPNFVEVMKNQRTLASLYNKLDTELARVKMSADAAATAIRAKRAWYLDAAKGYEHLFADLQALINRGDMEFFQLAVKNRVNDHKAAEEKRREDERARIQAEEKSKAEAAVAETLRLERAAEDERRLQAEDEARAQADAIAARTQAVMAEAQSQRAAESAPATPAQAQTRLPSPVASSPVVISSDDGRTVNLGQINAMLDGVSIDAKFLERKGFIPRQEKNAKLYRAADLPAIFAKIIHHVEAAAIEPFKAAA